MGDQVIGSFRDSASAQSSDCNSFNRQTPPLSRAPVMKGRAHLHRRGAINSLCPHRQLPLRRNPSSRKKSPGRSISRAWTKAGRMSPIRSRSSRSVKIPRPNQRSDPESGARKAGLGSGFGSDPEKQCSRGSAGGKPGESATARPHAQSPSGTEPATLHCRSPTTPVQGGQTRQTPPAPAPQNSGVAQHLEHPLRPRKVITDKTRRHYKVANPPLQSQDAVCKLIRSRVLHCNHQIMRQQRRQRTSSTSSTSSNSRQRQQRRRRISSKFSNSRQRRSRKQRQRPPLQRVENQHPLPRPPTRVSCTFHSRGNRRST